MDSARLPAFTLAEISFLVVLTSSDNGISELAAQGLRLISHAERLPDAPVNPYINEEDKSKRNPIYEHLGDPTITVAGKLSRQACCSILIIHRIGRLHHQRRVRKLIRMLTFSSGIQVVVWQECYNRWRVLDDKIHTFDTSVPETPMQQVSTYCPSFRGWMTDCCVQEIRCQWQNLTLYLAALSGVCYDEDIEAFALDKIVPRDMISDKLRVIENPRANIERFLETLIGHLMASENTIRDSVREALGSELGPRLYTRLLDLLKAYVFTFLIQSIHLIRTIGKSLLWMRWRMML
jgi:neurofibromin 1